MKTVKIDKAGLLEIIKKNREIHLVTFMKALDGFRRELKKELEQRLVNLASANKVELYIDLQEPVNYTKDYDRAIKMLEMSVDNVAELTEDDFSKYVLDEWAWKDQWAVGNSRYL